MSVRPSYEIVPVPEKCPACGGEMHMTNTLPFFKSSPWRVMCKKVSCYQGPCGETQESALEAHTAMFGIPQAVQELMKKWEANRRFHSFGFTQRDCAIQLKRAYGLEP